MKLVFWFQIFILQLIHNAKTSVGFRKPQDWLEMETAGFTPAFGSLNFMSWVKYIEADNSHGDFPSEIPMKLLVTILWT